MKTFILVSVLSLNLAGCAGLPQLADLAGQALPIIERFPFGHVIEAGKEAYCAVTKCEVPQTTPSTETSKP